MHFTKTSRFDTGPLQGADFYIDFGVGKYQNCTCAHLKQFKNLIGQVRYRKQQFKTKGLDVCPLNNQPLCKITRFI